MNIKTVVAKMIKYVKKVMSTIIECVKKMMKQQKDKSSDNNENEAFVIDDNWDIIMEKPKRDKKGKDEKKNMLEEFNEIKKRSFVQVTRGNKIIIKFDKEKDSIATINAIKIEENPYIEFMIKDNHIGAIVNVEFKTLKFKATCAHLMNMMQYDTVISYKHVNKMIVVDTNALGFREMTWTIRENDEIQWWTKDLKTNTNLFITTNVQSTILGYVKYKGRKRISCIGIITSFKPDGKYVYSGTLMTVRDKPFIVTYVHTTSAEIKSVIAVGLLQHDYEIVAE